MMLDPLDTPVVAWLKSELGRAEVQAEKFDRQRHYGHANDQAAEFYSGRVSGLRDALAALNQWKEINA